jgi:hypothetical protein
LANVLKACSALHVFTTSSSKPVSCGSSSSSSSSSGGEGGSSSSGSSSTAGSCLQDQEQQLLWSGTLAAVLRHPQGLNAMDVLQSIRALAELPNLDGSSSSSGNGSSCSSSRVPGFSSQQIEDAVQQLITMLMKMLKQQQQQQQQQHEDQEGQQVKWFKQIPHLLHNLALLGIAPAASDDMQILLEVVCESIAHLEGRAAASAVSNTLCCLSELQLHSQHWKMQQEQLEMVLQPQLFNKLFIINCPPRTLAQVVFSLAKLASLEGHQVSVPFVQDCVVQLLEQVTPQQLLTRYVSTAAAAAAVAAVVLHAAAHLVLVVGTAAL